VNENNANENDDFTDAEAWIIPLHGATVPLPETNTPPETRSSEPTQDSIPDYLFVQPEELPTDIGFQPRLRRSA
jgi:hypothetical protein